MGNVIAMASVASMAVVIMAFAAAIEYIDRRAAEKTALRRWERRVNQGYRENHEAALGSIR